MCKTCEIAENPNYEVVVDVKCAECCTRHIMRTIKELGTWGAEGHEGRIKDLLLEKLIRED